MIPDMQSPVQPSPHLQEILRRLGFQGGQPAPHFRAAPHAPPSLPQHPVGGGPMGDGENPDLNLGNVGVTARGVPPMSNGAGLAGPGEPDPVAAILDVLGRQGPVSAAPLQQARGAQNQRHASEVIARLFQRLGG